MDHFHPEQIHSCDCGSRIFETLEREVAFDIVVEFGELVLVVKLLEENYL